MGLSLTFIQIEVPQKAVEFVIQNVVRLKLLLLQPSYFEFQHRLFRHF